MSHLPAGSPRHSRESEQNDRREVQSIKAYRIRRRVCPALDLSAAGPKIGRPCELVGLKVFVLCEIAGGVLR